jgi:hypothetical protein
MTRQQLLDLYFLDARCKLLELAAFLDRVERAEGADDFRLQTFRQALSILSQAGGDKARDVLLAFSDPTTEPIPVATTKAACGAWPGASDRRPPPSQAGRPSPRSGAASAGRRARRTDTRR